MGARIYRNGRWVTVGDDAPAAVTRDRSAPILRELDGMTADEVVGWVGRDLDRAALAWEVELRRDRPRVKVQRHVERTVPHDG